MHAVLFASAGFFAVALAGKFELAVTSPWSQNAVLAPLVGASVPAGKPYTVQWQPDNLDSKYTVELYKGCPENCVYVKTLASAVANTGAYSWTPEDDCKGPGWGIKVICEGQKQFQWSGTFNCGAYAPVKAVAVTPSGYCGPSVETAEPGTVVAMQSCVNGVCSSYTSGGSTPAPVAPGAPVDIGAPAAYAPAPVDTAAPAPFDTVAPAPFDTAAPAPVAPAPVAPAPQSAAPVSSSPADQSGPLQFAAGSASTFGVSIAAIVAATAIVAAAI